MTQACCSSASLKIIGSCRTKVLLVPNNHVSLFPLFRFAVRSFSPITRLRPFYLIFRWNISFRNSRKCWFKLLPLCSHVLIMVTEARTTYLKFHNKAHLPLCCLHIFIFRHEGCLWVFSHPCLGTVSLWSQVPESQWLPCEARRLGQVPLRCWLSGMK